ncbi:hypothetical protein ACVWWG_006226 [Bradyrhizobium sp. LB7.2]
MKTKQINEMNDLRWKFSCAPMMDWTGTSQKAKRNQCLGTVVGRHAVPNAVPIWFSSVRRRLMSQFGVHWVTHAQRNVLRQSARLCSFERRCRSVAFIEVVEAANIARLIDQGRQRPHVRCQWHQEASRGILSSSPNARVKASRKVGGSSFAISSANHVGATSRARCSDFALVACFPGSVRGGL